MSRSRVMADGASLVCSVVKTMWPVSDAWIEISAVSRSRVSPTRILSGSCRRMARRQAAEGDADLGVDRHLHQPVDVVFDGLLGGDDLLLDGVFSSLSVAYSVVVLPDDVGPVTRMMPLGLWITSRQMGQQCRSAMPILFRCRG